MYKQINKIISIFMLLIITFFSLFGSLLSVKAASSYKGKITGSSVSFRSKATTAKNEDSSNNIIDYLNKGEIITVTDSTLITGAGCSAGWLSVYYDGNNGYVCSSYITSDLTDIYDRPWNTPKKAIIGGAKWIANGYINNGQFTSYLKKFNENPDNGNLYNHEYQTNIAAPYQEALSSYKAYSANNMMELNFTFNIPVYENMADSYLNPTGMSVNLSDRIDVIEDTTFEAYLDAQGFPASNRPFLRWFHKNHPTGTFIAMKTGLDFNTSVSIEMNAGSIYSTDNRVCLDNNCSANPTNEKNWYYPNAAITAYYMDPRNFLNESFIFMFESLTYSDKITESMVQTILNGTFMSGKETNANQTYASIFIEAGKTAGVNPIYLAALAKQECGANGSVATSGETFTYKDITYIGLYNFYNIGAYSSAEIPIRQGLVYASGGVCTNCGTYVAGNNSNSSNNTTKVSYTSISSIGLTSSGSYVNGFSVGTTIATLKAKANDISYSSSDVIATGTVITLGDGNKYTAVVYGDLTGDGIINSADLLKMRQYLLGTANLTDAYLEAAHTAKNGTVNSADLLKMCQYLLGTSNIVQS